MNTTLLFAELLIIGLQAGVWLFFLFLSIFGLDWLQTLQATKLSDWQTLILIISLSFFYVLGVIIDRVADALFAKWDWRIRRRAFPDPALPIVVLRFELGRDNEYLNRQFEYNRSRMRIARASSVNFGLTTLLALVFLLTRVHTAGPEERWDYAFAILIVGIVLTGSAALTWRKLMRGYFGMLRDYSESGKVASQTSVEESNSFSQSAGNQRLHPTGATGRQGNRSGVAEYRGDLRPPI
jgi:hypothetical protein